MMLENTKESKNVKLRSIKGIDITEWDAVPEDNIAQYKGKPGVWILIGKKHGQVNAPVECLQVAQTKDIGKEIEENISYLENTDFEPKCCDYINQFGEYKFTYKVYPDRRMYLYKEIAKEYGIECLRFVCVAYEIENDSLRKNIEKYVAYRTLCQYWVNGGPYKKKGEEEIRSIKKARKKECETLCKTIKEKYGKKTGSLDKFLTDLNEGSIEI